MTDEKLQLRPYAIQLGAVYCVVARVERSDQVEDQATDQAVRIGSTPLEEDKRSFKCRLALDWVVPILSGEMAHLEVTVQGQFASTDDISIEDHAAFVSYTPLVMLWPYARAYVAELARMIGAELPPLPLIDQFGDAEAIDVEQAQPAAEG